LYLGVSSLEDRTQERNISIFPNPVEDYIRIAIHDYLPQSASIRIYNQQGRLMMTKTLAGTTTLIDMSGLAPGVYVYEVYDVGERLGGGKMVKRD